MSLRIESPDEESQFELYTGASGDTRVQCSDRVPEAELTDEELLDQAAREAVQAHSSGLVGGPVLDEVQLLRARRRARGDEPASHAVHTDFGQGAA